MIYSKNKVFIAVIHIIDTPYMSIEDHALNNANIAFKNGADGIFIVPAIYPFSQEETIKV